jgi:hypothetical protein
MRGPEAAEREYSRELRGVLPCIGRVKNRRSFSEATRASVRMSFHEHRASYDLSFNSESHLRWLVIGVWIPHRRPQTAVANLPQRYEARWERGTSKNRSVFVEKLRVAPSLEPFGSTFLSIATICCSSSFHSLQRRPTRLRIRGVQSAAPSSRSRPQCRSVTGAGASSADMLGVYRGRRR